MKYLSHILFFLLIGTTVSAQLNISLVVSATPPGTLSDWGNRKEVFTLLVFNPQGTIPRKAIIKTTLLGANGNIAGSTDLARAMPFSFPGGNTILGANDALPLGTMVFTGKYKASLERTGKLPAEVYIICVQLVSPVDFVPITEERCRNFSIASYQLPIAVMPFDGSVLDAAHAQTAITFRWTPLAPVTTLAPTYRLQVFEVLEGQKPMQAFRSNPPLVDKDIRGTTQYIWQPQLNMTVCSNCPDSVMPVKQFIWTIQTLDPRGLPVGDGNINNDGRSQPILFQVQPAKRKSAARATLWLNTRGVYA